MRCLPLLMLVAACSQLTVPEPAVVLDPGNLDLGEVVPTTRVERQFVVADVRETDIVAQLDSLEIVGEDAAWLELVPSVPLPSDLDIPVRVTIATIAVPIDGPVGLHRVQVIARGELEGEAFEETMSVTFSVEPCDQDQDGALRLECGGGDCEDLDPAIRPGVTELCNGIDDDCNNIIDDAGDVDLDGVSICSDCDDLDPGVYPGADERCNGIDDDCNGLVPDDEFDFDGDSFRACDDCDDANPSIYPGAREVCDGIDNDCDGLLDDFSDRDGDGSLACEDCDDDDPQRFPGQEEACNGIDDNCDDLLRPDEIDADGDGWLVCAGDCDDTDGSVSPGAPEVCNAMDDNCNVTIDEGSACPCGVENAFGDVYLFCEGEEVWTDARDACDAWGYHLVTIDNAREDAWTFSTVRSYDADRKWWTGLNDRRREGTFVWADGSGSTYRNWEASEPNDSGGDEDCGQLNRYVSWEWNDEPCSRDLPFVCEID